MKPASAMEAALALEPGAAIDGFTLGPRVHAGGMGYIFRVSKPDDPRPLLMKLPRLGPEEPSEAIVSFETEATIAPTLQGPHVPAFVAAGDLTRTPYLVLEWVDGKSLDQVLAAGPLVPLEAARVGAAVADALHSLHQQDVIHLDLKPSNLVLREDGTAVLIDFGFAHHAKYPDLLAEETHFRAASAPYVSPEQLLSSREDRRSDIFALGVILYEATTGRLPFGDPDTDVRNRFWLDPVPPSVLAPNVPPWFQEIILRCLEPSAEARYQSAAHVAFDLRNPDQVRLTARATKRQRAGWWSHLRRFLRARAEIGPRLRVPQALLSRTPIVLVAIDTSNVDDERHPAIRFAVSQILAVSAEFRLICLSVIPPAASPLEHLVRLRHWASPFQLPVQRLSLHAMESLSPADTIVEFARHNNVDLIVLGAPVEGGRAWSNSTASTVTANARCSVHVVRVPAARP
ncbi:MAG TPA: bifunctional serine/threonine-protein kinase/universal stress protein [Polyangiaceae bacterium]|nr:bifunctional serine/threonine-protein kinase/universal stress protein [Polyangiaceae bacterium]